MSPIETQGDILSETEAGHSEGDSLKLVPVGESIRYRKRAQSAEKKVEALSGQLAEAKAAACEMAEQLNSIRLERELIRKLATAGAVDLETAVLIAKARTEAQEEADVDGVIEQLKKEKQYLFTGQQGVAVTARKTAGAKDRMTNKQTILERAAKKAATTGNRTDLQEYLKLRRNFV
jgi:nickel-dependent lactate racemase